MTEKPTTPEMDWKNIDESMASRLLAQAQTFLDAQFRAAQALDQRAMTSASIFIAFSAAIIGFAAQNEVLDEGMLTIPAIVSAAFLLVAAVLAFWAARPVDFYYPGSHPREWWPVAFEPLKEVLAGESENYQEAIDHNDSTLRHNRRLVNYAMIFAGLAPTAGLISWIFL